MFKDNLTIHRIDSRSGFVDINASAFTLGEGKVVFKFRQYNKNAQAGNKITAQTDIYMDIDEFDYFCSLMISKEILVPINNAKKKAYNEAKAICGPDCPKDQIIEVAKQNFAKVYPQGYSALSGSAAKGISRCLSIEKNAMSKYAATLRGMQGKGEVNETGLIVPKYKFNEAEALINIPITEEDVVKIGLDGKRAIRYFDMWSAMGVLEQNVNRLQNKWKEDTGA